VRSILHGNAHAAEPAGALIQISQRHGVGGAIPRHTQREGEFRCVDGSQDQAIQTLPSSPDEVARCRARVPLICGVLAVCHRHTHTSPFQACAGVFQPHADFVPSLDGATGAFVRGEQVVLPDVVDEQRQNRRPGQPKPNRRPVCGSGESKEYFGARSLPAPRGCASGRRREWPKHLRRNRCERRNCTADIGADDLRVVLWESADGSKCSLASLPVSLEACLLCCCQT